MTEARGDLNFLGDIGSDETRSIVVNCIERPDSQPTPPIVKNELSFVDLAAPVLDKEQPTTSVEVVNRRWIIEARLKSMAAGHESGQLLVVDPWDSGHFQAIQVHREVPPPLQVSPRRAILNVGDEGDAASPIARFSIMSREPIDDLIVEWEGATDTQLTLSGPKAGANKRRFGFDVTWKGSVDSEKTYHLRIARRSSSDSIVVPIVIRREAPR